MMMKNKVYFLVCLLAMISLQAMGQAKKPKLMVVPSDNWCIKRGYTMTFDNQGTEEVIPDYKKALQNDSELNNMITRIGNMMSDRGFNLVDLENSIKSINRFSAEDNLITSKRSGSSLAERPLDQLRRTAKCDIVLQLDWQVNTNGPKKSITYNLRGLDAYSNKQVAGAQGTGVPSMSADLPVLLEEAATVHMDNFTNRLQSHFDDMVENGREVVVDVRVFDNDSGIDLETEYDGVELAEAIENWMSDNTVNHRFDKSDGTENYILFEQVRIPMFQPNGSGMSTENFVRGLRNFLKSAPYNLTTKVLTRGQGRCMLIIGEK